MPANKVKVILIVLCPNCNTYYAKTRDRRFAFDQASKADARAYEERFLQDPGIRTSWDEDTMVFGTDFRRKRCPTCRQIDSVTVEQGGARIDPLNDDGLSSDPDSNGSLSNARKALEE